MEDEKKSRGKGMLFHKSIRKKITEKRMEKENGKRERGECIKRR